MNKKKRIPKVLNRKKRIKNNAMGKLVVLNPYTTTSNSTNCTFSIANVS